MEILAYSHLTSIQSPGGEDLPLPTLRMTDEQLQGVSALAGVVVLSSTALGSAPAFAQTLLAQNDSGTEVVRVQDRLAELGYFDASSTGFFGPITTRAVQSFQRSQGLTPDGVVGAQTIAALFNTPSPASTTPQTPSTPAISSSPESQSSSFTAEANPSTAQLQQDLLLLGFDVGKVDGLFGDKTVSALKAFQTSVGLEPNGFPDIATLEALESSILASLDIGVATAKTNNPGAQVSAEVTRVIPSISPSGGDQTQVLVQNDKDSIVVQRGSQTGQVLVQNSPDRILVETLKTTDLTPRDLGVNVAINPTPEQVALGVGGDAVSSPTLLTTNSLPYVVAVPDPKGDVLEDVKAIYPGAYVVDSQRGAYVYTGSFADRLSAETLTKTVQAEGLAARVAFRP